MRGLLTALLIFLALWLSPAHASPSSSSTSELLVSRARPYGGAVTKFMAERAALLDAELTVYDVAVRRLAELPELRFVGGIGEELPTYVPDPEALVRIIFPIEFVSRDFGAEKDTTAVQVNIKAACADAGLREKVIPALREKGRMELVALAIPRQRQLLELYDETSAGLLSQKAGTANKSRLAESKRRDKFAKLVSICNEMAALDIFLKQLDDFSDTFKQPEEAMRSLQNATELAPDNALILAGFGEACLLMDRAVPARDAVEKALSLEPEFARAHDLKGILLLRSQLPSLAAASFSRAVELSPANPDYLVHRGSAYLVQEEADKACEDFLRACVIGGCAEYEWAIGSGLCVPRPEDKPGADKGRNGSVD